MLAQDNLSLENVEIVRALKQALKTRGITYKQVAQHLNVSEKTIKRLFQDKDCSLSRLNDICAMMGMSIYDLLDFSRHYHEPMIQLTNDQERYLQNNDHHFSFLFFLMTGYSVDEIQGAYELSDLEIFRYLRDLDREGFIELGPHNSVRLRFEGRVLMSIRGPLRAIIKERNQLFFDYVFDQKDDAKTSMYGAFRFMDEQTLVDLKNDLAALVKQYRKRAQQNELLLPREKLKPIKLTALVGEFPVCGIWPLQALER